MLLITQILDFMSSLLLHDSTNDTNAISMSMSASMSSSLFYEHWQTFQMSALPNLNCEIMNLIVSFYYELLFSLLQFEKMPIIEIK